MSSMIRGTVSLVVPLIVGFAAQNAAVAQARNAAAGTACASLASRSFANTTIASAEVVAAGALSVPIAGPPGLAVDYSKLPSFCRVVGLDQADGGLGHPVRGVAPRRALERQVPSDGQRRRRRGARPCVDGGAAVTRLCGGSHRHRPSGRTRGFRLGRRPPGETDRLPVPCRARAHRRRQSDHGGALRGSARQVVLERLLDGRPPGSQGSPALSRGLRCDRRRRAREQLVGADVAQRSRSSGISGPTGSAPTSSGCSRKPPSRPAMPRTA